MTSKKVRDGYRLARKVHLAMTIYNVSTARVVFANKLLNLSGGIVGLYFFVRLVLIQPVLAMFFFALAFDCITYYTVTWDNASLIPVMLKELKDQVRLATASDRADHNGRYMIRAIRSIPDIGMSVGGFRCMERDSTLIFMDFVLSNVLSLLMAFKL